MRLPPGKVREAVFPGRAWPPAEPDRDVYPVDAVLTCRARSCMLKASRRGTLQYADPRFFRDGRSITRFGRSGGGRRLLIPLSVPFRSAPLLSPAGREGFPAARRAGRATWCGPSSVCRICSASCLLFVMKCLIYVSLSPRGVEALSVAPPAEAERDASLPAPSICASI